MNNKKYFILTIICISLFTLAHSQINLKKQSAIKFQSSLQAGSLFGQAGSKPALTVSVINGIRTKEWFAGIGVGIDYYGAKRSIPLFAALQKSLSKKPNSFFLYGNAGYNFGWLKESEKRNRGSYVNQTGGLFYDAGIGYQFKISKINKLGFTVGYTFKQTKEAYFYPCWYCGNDIGIPPPEIENYKFRTIALKFNWWFL